MIAWFLLPRLCELTGITSTTWLTLWMRRVVDNEPYDYKVYTYYIFIKSCAEPTRNAPGLLGLRVGAVVKCLFRSCWTVFEA